MPLLLTKTNSTKSRVRKTTLSKKIEIGMSSLVCITIVLICGLTLTYLTHTNKTATRAYELKIIKEERETLINQSEILNMKISRVQSLINIEKDPLVMAMGRYDTPMFIRGDTAVASNK